VLRVAVGGRVRAGVIGGGIGTAEVIGDDGATYTLRLVLDGAPPPVLPVDLVLAVPRPKVVTRVIETCAAFGVRRVDLTNAWRVDKSYLRSRGFAPEALAHAARLGRSKARTTHLPALAVHERLMTLVDTRFAAPGGTAVDRAPRRAAARSDARRRRACDRAGGRLDRPRARDVHRARLFARSRSAPGSCGARPRSPPRSASSRC